MIKRIYFIIFYWNGALVRNLILKLWDSDRSQSTAYKNPMAHLISRIIYRSNDRITSPCSIELPVLLTAVWIRGWSLTAKEWSRSNEPFVDRLWERAPFVVKICGGDRDVLYTIWNIRKSYTISSEDNGQRCTFHYLA